MVFLLCGGPASRPFTDCLLLEMNKPQIARKTKRFFLGKKLGKKLGKNQARHTKCVWLTSG